MSDIMKPKKSGITETMALTLAGCSGTMFYQFLQGGFANISESAFTAWFVALVSLALQLIRKYREKKECENIL